MEVHTCPAIFSAVGWIGLLALFCLAACTPGANTPDGSADATAQALAAARFTQTAEAIPPPSDTPAPSQSPVPTGTPLPTATPTPTDTPLPTATSTPLGGGEWIAYVSNRLGSPFYSDVFLQQPGLGDPIPLTGGNSEGNSWPGWSSDGGQLFFVSTRNGPGELFSFDLAKGALSGLVKSPGEMDGPSLSVQGMWAFSYPFCSSCFPPLYTLYRASLDGTALNRITNKDLNYQDPEWSPNGSEIVAVQSADPFAPGDIVKMGDHGQNFVNLTSHPAHDADPTWSPDGGQIAFASRRDGNWEIYLMDPDGGNLVNLTNHAADDRYPTWSPDGRQMAFSSDRDGNLEIYILSLDDGALTRLTDDPGDDIQPSWSPGNTLLDPSLLAAQVPDPDATSEPGGPTQEGPVILDISITLPKTVAFTVKNFNPNEEVTVEVTFTSSGVILYSGTESVNQDGRKSISFNLKQALEDGDYSITVRGASGLTASGGFRLSSE